jgi:hypothetical protein
LWTEVLNRFVLIGNRLDARHVAAAAIDIAHAFSRSLDSM